MRICCKLLEIWDFPIFTKSFMLGIKCCLLADIFPIFPCIYNQFVYDTLLWKCFLWKCLKCVFCLYERLNKTFFFQIKLTLQLHVKTMYGIHICALQSTHYIPYATYKKNEHLVTAFTYIGQHAIFTSATYIITFFNQNRHYKKY